MPNLTIFKSPFMESLRGNIRTNLPKYQSDSPWASNTGTRHDRDLPTSLALRNPLDLCLPVAGNLKDIENAVRMHKALPQLTRLQARDPRLWTRLTHCELWSYMRSRWPIEKYVKDGENVTAGRVLERYFVPQSQSRALMRNGAARLWWSAHLTYDEKRSNQYELTGVLFSTLDVTQTILERGLGRAPNILAGFLDFLLVHRNELLTGGNVNRERIRGLAKFLNLRGGVCVLDCLSKADVIAWLEAQYQQQKKNDEANA